MKREELIECLEKEVNTAIGLSLEGVSVKISVENEERIKIEIKINGNFFKQTSLFMDKKIIDKKRVDYVKLREAIISQIALLFKANDNILMISKKEDLK